VLDNVRMVKSSQDLDLPLDLFKDVLLLNVLLVQDFDSHLVVGHFVESHYTRQLEDTYA